MKDRNNLCTVAAFVGLFIVVFSAASGTGILKLGRSPGFGTYEIQGCFYGGMIMLVSLILKFYYGQKKNSRPASVSLIVFGVLVLIIGMPADLLGSGTYTRFGMIQMSCLLLGWGSVILGWMQLRRKDSFENSAVKS